MAWLIACFVTDRLDVVAIGIEYVRAVGSLTRAQASISNEVGAGGAVSHGARGR
jgi:hypothetical protein